jgi:hypothetical protein
MATTEPVDEAAPLDEAIQLGPLRVSRRGAFRLRAVAVAITGVVLFATVILTSAGVLVDKSFYENSLQDAHAYDRFYTQILADKKFNEVTDEMLGSLPVDKSLVTSNLRVIIPPSTLRALVGSTISSLTAYLRNQRDNIDLGVAVEPLVDNVRSLAEHYLIDAVVNTPSFQSKNLDDFGDGVVKFFADIQAGRKPKFLPNLPLTPSISNSIATLIVKNLPPSQQATALPQIQASLASGDLNGAFALAAVDSVKLPEDRSAAALKLEVGKDGEVDFTASVDQVDSSAPIGMLKTVRFVLGSIYPIAIIGLVLLLVAGLATIGWITGRLGRSRWRAVAWTLVIGGVVAGSIWVILWWLAPDPLSSVLTSSNRDMAPSVRNVLGDTWTDARDALSDTVATTALIVVVAGALIFLAIRLAPRFERLWRTSKPRFWGLSTVCALVVAFFLFGSVTIRVEPTSGSGLRRCNGHTQLCDRRFNDVTFAASHNSMAGADRQYISAMQDLTITDQLESGIRGLLIDAHYWETPDVTTAFLASVPPETAEALRPLLEGANPVKPGAWWCHALCRLGAEPLAAGFKEVSDFLARNPDEVVTLVIEDYVSRDDIAAGVKQSGLEKYVFTPPDDPNFTWPTLGQMIDRNQRVVILSEKNAQLTAPNYYRQFYRYGEETPYDHPGPSDMSCASNRGGTGKSLFLMNHWITRATGSRADAGIVNRRKFIVDRARRCEAARHHRVNFVAVDFTTIGDVFGAVDELNGFKPGSGQT